MNIYRIPFSVKCPNNSHVISYSLSVESKATIMVEDIVAAVDALPDDGFQEDIADQLADALPGLHTITAHHGGVDIETRRKGRKDRFGRFACRIGFHSLKIESDDRDREIILYRCRYCQHGETFSYSNWHAIGG